MRCPPTLSAQLLQSPFLQLYRGLIPRPDAAFFMGLPALKFFFFPLWVKIVMPKADDRRQLDEETDMKAFALATMLKRVIITDIKDFIVTIFLWFDRIRLL